MMSWPLSVSPSPCTSHLETEDEGKRGDGGKRNSTRRIFRRKKKKNEWAQQYHDTIPKGELLCFWQGKGCLGMFSGSNRSGRVRWECEFTDSCG